MAKMNELVKEYRGIRKEYARDGSEFDEDEPRVSAVKRIIETLPEAERAMILLYADRQSYRKLGHDFGVSHMTARTEIMKIRAKILAEYDKRIH